MRRLYLVAYDITDSRRLGRVRNFLKAWSTGGQKSVYECFLSDAELEDIRRGLAEIIEVHEDRVHILALDGRSRTHTLGRGVQPRDPAFFYFG